MTKTLSLDSIEKQIANEEPSELEPFLPNGDPSGITLLVKSDQAPSVVETLNKLANERRRKEALAAAQASKSRPGESFVTVEQDSLFYRRLVVARLAGWKGLEDEFSEDNALRLLKAAPGFAPQILEKSGELTSFTTASAKS